MTHFTASTSGHGASGFHLLKLARDTTRALDRYAAALASTDSASLSTATRQDLVEHLAEQQDLLGFINHSVHWTNHP